MSNNQAYTEDHVRSLDWKEHIRHRPGMYIGRLGDGTSKDDGIYLLLKEVIDNGIDEYVMGNGTTIRVILQDDIITVRDFGQGSNRNIQSYEEKWREMAYSWIY